MKRKPKPPTSAWWCPSCGRVLENYRRHTTCGAMDCDGTHGTTLVHMDIVPSGGARVVRMARAWVNSGGAREDRLTENALFDAVDAMERKEEKR